MPPLDVGRLASIIGPARVEQLQRRVVELREAMRGRTVWNVNSTAAGGGVAEMLGVLVGYGRGAGLSVTWSVIDADSRFFEITKRIHHRLHGMPGDGGPLGAEEQRHYRAVLDRNAAHLLPRIAPGDVVILHDPQTAGLAPVIRDAGAVAIWRCHIGADTPNEWTADGWQMLRPHLAAAYGMVFSRRAYIPEWASNAVVVPPSIDPFSPKNQDLAPATATAILARMGLLAADDSSTAFVRRDGTTGAVTSKAHVVSDRAPIPADTPLIVQVSRWDPLKDMIGVMRAFESTAQTFQGDLVLAGPSVSAIADDPEGARVYAACLAAWQSLPSALRRRVHLLSLPMDDLDANAAMVNSLQRHATIVVQKSLAEGFGLTVTEAMWKGRPVIASAVGGIPDQLSASTGVLLDDPADLLAAGTVMRQLMVDPARRERLGRAARKQVVDKFVGDKHLLRYAALLRRVLRAGRTG